MTQHYMTDQNGYIIFIAEITAASSHRLEVKVYSVISWDQDKTPGDRELYCEAMFRWDGCGHVWFGEQDNGRPTGYLHLCGAKYWKEHIAMMEWLYKLGQENITHFCKSERWDEEGA